MKKVHSISSLIFRLFIIAVLTISCGGGGGGEGGGTLTTQAYPRFSYTLDYSGGTVSAYWLDANTGRLKFVSRTATGPGPVWVAVDPSGKYAYVTNESASPGISQYTIGADGSLTPMTPAAVATGTDPWVITVGPSGKYVYVTNRSSNNVSQYTIGANGALTPMTPATVAAGTGPLVLRSIPRASMLTWRIRRATTSHSTPSMQTVPFRPCPGLR